MAILVLRYISDHDYRFVNEPVYTVKDYGLMTVSAGSFVDFGQLV